MYKISRDNDFFSISTSDTLVPLCLIGEKGKTLVKFLISLWIKWLLIFAHFLIFIIDMGDQHRKYYYCLKLETGKKQPLNKMGVFLLLEFHAKCVVDIWPQDCRPSMMQEHWKLKYWKKPKRTKNTKDRRWQEIEQSVLLFKCKIWFL